LEAAKDRCRQHHAEMTAFHMIIGIIG